MLQHYIKKQLKLIKENLSDYESDGTIELYHYTTSDRDVITLTPSRFGEQAFTKREMRTSSFPRIFFYLDTKHKERFFEGKTLYSTEVLRSEIYDLKEDVKSFAETVRQETGGAIDFDKLFQYIMNDGFNGVYYTVSNMDVVAWFKPIVVQKHIYNTEETDMSNEQIINFLKETKVTILSAERGNLSTQENLVRTNNLKRDIEAMGFEYLEASGGYVEKDEQGNPRPVDGEASFLVWGGRDLIKRSMELGEKYDQETILLNSKGRGFLIGTDPNSDFYKKRDPLGNLVPNSKSMYFTRVGDFYFEYK